jgi:hypothetical protein
MSRTNARKSSISRAAYTTIEALEDRRLQSATLSGTVLTIHGTSGADRHELSISASKKFVVVENGKASYFPAASVKTVKYFGGGSGDILKTRTNYGYVYSVLADGGSGDDYLQGNNGNDVLRGQGNNDTIVGGGGRDRLEGGDGNDKLDGQFGGDTIIGNAGADEIRSHDTRPDRPDFLYIDSADNVYKNTWDVVNGQAATRPAAPGSLTAGQASTSQVQLSWQDNANNETGYEIYWSRYGTDYYHLTNVGANVTSTTIGGLSGSQDYFYKVRATNAAGPSAFSNPVHVRTLRPELTAATNLRWSLVGRDAVLQWDNNGGADQFLIQIQMPDGLGWQWHNWAVGSETRTWTLPNPAPGFPYQFRVIAFHNVQGFSGPSNEILVRV